MGYTAFVTPFEISFLDDDTAGDGLFICNRLIDFIFICDIVLVFFLPFRAPVDKGGVWVYSSKKIAKNYLKGWFLVDLISTFPFDLILRGTGNTDSGNGGAVVRVSSVLRASRTQSCPGHVVCGTACRRTTRRTTRWAHRAPFPARRSCGCFALPRSSASSAPRAS